MSRRTPRCCITGAPSGTWCSWRGGGKSGNLPVLPPSCTSGYRHTDVVWPDQISAAEAADRYGTDDTTGVESAREAAQTGPVYLLANGRARLDSFREAGFDVVPVERDGSLYELVPRSRG